MIVPPYAEQVKRFEEAVAKLREITPTPDAVDGLPDEGTQAEFAKALREVLRLRNIMSSYSEHEPAALPLPPQDFQDYKSKYLDLEQLRHQGGGNDEDGPLDHIDFELELLRRDEVNVADILALIATLKAAEGKAGERKARAIRKRILDLLNGEASLLPKKEVVETILAECLPALGLDQDVGAAFASFWSEAR